MKSVKKEEGEGLIKNKPRIGQDSYKPSVTLNLNAFLRLSLTFF